MNVARDLDTGRMIELGVYADRIDVRQVPVRMGHIHRKLDWSEFDARCLGALGRVSRGPFDAEQLRALGFCRAAEHA